MGYCWTCRSGEDIAELRDNFNFVLKHSKSSFTTVCRLFAKAYGYKSPQAVEKIVTYQSYRNFGGLKSYRGFVSQGDRYLYGSTAMTLHGKNKGRLQLLMDFLAYQRELKIAEDDYVWYRKQTETSRKCIALNKKKLIGATRQLKSIGIQV